MVFTTALLARAWSYARSHMHYACNKGRRARVRASYLCEKLLELVPGQANLTWGGPPWTLSGPQECMIKQLLHENIKHMKSSV